MRQMVFRGTLIALVFDFDYLYRSVDKRFHAH